MDDASDSGQSSGDDAWFYEPDDDARDRAADPDEATDHDLGVEDLLADDLVTEDGTEGDPAAAGAIDPADAALSRARAGRRPDWAAAGARPQRRPRRRRSTGPTQYSGAGADERDPARLGDLVSGMVSARGWEAPLDESRVFVEWRDLVGPEVADHAEPVSLTEGHLRVSAVSTAWATQLRLLSAGILARLADQVGAGVVRRLTITGPVAPSWKHGPRSVPGARGPRDTYG